ncbi:MAG: hypothetical protein ACD_22C00106G0020 [uncultured bacterium]|nr:MAG: hypothetical protein ACD_22C00106G0020 [uncultured bacterium]
MQHEKYKKAFFFVSKYTEKEIPKIAVIVAHSLKYGNNLIGTVLK